MNKRKAWKQKPQSIAGCILFMQNVSISWQSKAQKSTTLSSSEAEFVALPGAERRLCSLLSFWRV